MYRPTVRYDDRYAVYVNDLFHAVHLDRNQVIRLALVSAPFSSLFLSRLELYRKEGAAIPAPAWTSSHNELWRESECTLLNMVESIGQGRNGVIVQIGTSKPRNIDDVQLLG